MCVIAMNEIRNQYNSDLHRLMAVKFLKSLFTLNDRDILDAIKNNDIFGCVAQIVN